MFTKHLLECGFGAIETKIIDYLLRHGASTASIIAKRISIKRPTVYAHLDTLIDQGYVTKSSSSGSTRFSAMSPQNLPSIIKNRAEVHFETIKDATSSLNLLLKELPQTKKREFAGFEVETVESERGIYSHLYSSLLTGEFCAIFDPQIAITPHAKKIIREFLEKTATTRPHIREIVAQGKTTSWYTSHIINPHHLVKVVDHSHKLPCDMILTDNSLLVISYVKGEESLIRITHPLLFQSMMTTLNLLWGLI